MNKSYTYIDGTGVTKKVVVIGKRISTNTIKCVVTKTDYERLRLYIE